MSHEEKHFNNGSVLFKCHTKTLLCRRENTSTLKLKQLNGIQQSFIYVFFFLLTLCFSWRQNVCYEKGPCWVNRWSIYGIVFAIWTCILFKHSPLYFWTVQQQWQGQLSKNVSNLDVNSEKSKLVLSHHFTTTVTEWLMFHIYAFYYF